MIKGISKLHILLTLFLRDIAQELEKKTGLKMESEMIEDFKTKVLNGDFNEAAACVKSIMG